jgi:flagellar biosynthesis/type III secretory pathway chaperone
MSKPSTQIAELERVLRDEISLYESYADCLIQDADLMTQMKIDELEKSNKAKATLLLKIEAVDQLRQRIVKEIALEVGLSEDRIRMTDLCEKLDSGSSKSLLGLRDRLREVTNKIRKIQEDASAFVQSSLSWIDGSMSTLRRLLAPTGTYNARGRVDHPSSFAGRVVENKA